MTGGAPEHSWARAAALLPGPGYQQHLLGMHVLLRPATYLEIGVAEGDSLHLARPPTRAFGVDPNPTLNDRPFAATTRVFAMTSDAFFEPAHWAREVGGDTAIDLAFIDGLHLFEQALRDFINVERHAAPHAVVALHDTLPLSPDAAAREQVPGLWCGDTWRILPCLEARRPDLFVTTIPTAPSGLTVVTGLDPSSRVLETHFDAIVAEFLALPYGWLEARLQGLIAGHENSATTLARAIAAGRTGAAAR